MTFGRELPLIRLSAAVNTPPKKFELSESLQVATQMWALGAIAVAHSESSTVSMLSPPGLLPPGPVQLLVLGVNWGWNWLNVPPNPPRLNCVTKLGQSETSMSWSSTTAMVMPAPVRPLLYSAVVL